MEDLIAGVVVKELVSHPDQRGFFREIFRFNEPIFEKGRFGQWSHSKMTQNVVKAWHFHHIQTDWWYVPLGCIEAVLFDNREESPTYKKKMVILMGDSKCGVEGAKEVVVRIPPGVLHGCKVLTDEAHLLYITSETYNPNDEGRYPYNSAIVPHNWGENIITSPNDRRTFMPPSERKKI